MGQASIGKAALVLTTDASGARAGLDQFGAEARQSINKTAANTRVAGDKAAREVEASFEKTQGKLNKSFGKFAKKEGGFLGMVGGGVIGDLGLAGPAALLTGAFLAGKQLHAVLDDTDKKLKAIAADVAEGGKAIERAFRRKDEWLAIPDDREAELGRINNEVIALEQSFARQKDHVAELNAEVERLTGLWKPGIWGERLRGDRPIAEAELKAAEDAETRLHDRLTDLKEKRDRKTNPKTDPAFLAEIGGATRALKDQVTTWGLTGTAAERALLVQRGATDKVLAGLDTWAAKVQKLREAEAEHLRTVERSTLNRSTNPLLGEFGRVLADPRRFDRMEPIERSGGQGFGRLGSLLSMGIAAAGEALKPALQGAKAMKLDNAALVKGTSAEVSARLRHEMGARTAAEKTAENTAATNTKLTEVIAGLRAVAERLPPGVIPF